MRTASKERSTWPSGEGDGSVVSAEQPANGKAGAKTAEAKSKVPMWEFLMDEERDVDGTETWLYRLQPVIDRKQGEHCICKKKGRFTRDDILKDFGSGLYEVFVHNSRGKTIYTEKISFHNQSYPPKLDPRELVAGDPRNALYLEMFSKPAEKSAKDVPAADVTALLNTVVSKSGS